MASVSKKIRVGIIGDPGLVKRSFEMTTEKAYKQCGNTGNLAFRYAISNHVNSTKKYFRWTSDPKQVKEFCDLILFPAANQVDPRYDWNRMADFIEQVDLPCLIIGLGAQASDLDPNLHLKLQQGTVRWLKAISERSISIGVRGQYTADVLAKLGIHNTEILGCPTNFINNCPDVGKRIEDKLTKLTNLAPRNIVVTDGAGRAKLKYLEQKLIDWTIKYSGWYICQSPENIVKLARKRFDEIPNNWLRRFHQYLLPHLSYEEFIVFVKRHFLVFFDAAAWLEFLSSVDLSLGTRLHGNMLAIQSLTPGICIAHDSRTTELCQTMMMPHLQEQEFMSARNIKELIELTSFDGTSYDRNRIKLAEKYITLLLKNGVDVHNDLQEIAKNKESTKSNILENLTVISKK